MFQFIIETFNLETIFGCVQKVALQLEKVRDPQYYILTATVNAYKERFQKLQRQTIYKDIKKEYEQKVEAFFKDKQEKNEKNDEEKI